METPPPLWSRSTDKILERVIKWGLAIGLLGFVAVFLLPGLDGRGHPARRTECKNHLKQLALAMHNYHDTYGCFPPAYVADKDGQPMHSWRVLLLPFLEFRQLYDEYRFDEPWNGPHNRKLAELSIALFKCPAQNDAKPETNYFVVVGPKTIFPGDKTIAIKDITDGTHDTILLVEAVDSGINWLEPRDMSYEEAARGINPKSGWGISSRHDLTEGGCAQVAFADGSVRFLRDDTDVGQLRRMLERDDGLPVSIHY
jgi:prepilin-type processing-associated H-X9-DG protein